ncbi:ParB/RepB/Spo0J family partition protein [Gammaproteobacteria bacterium]|nr:ParB/RepB/Spo0J family partition protein [Gammaproteobacteria bacterium]
MMAKKRGLGKSLDALLVGSMPIIDESEDERTGESLESLSVNLIQPGKYQPRSDATSDGLEDLTNSIRSQGIIQPIIVRHVLGGKFEIIAGERRWRAAQLAGLDKVPAIIRDIPDESAIAMALIENIQRENLNSIDEAIALQRLLNEFSMTHNQVADAVGKSRASVTNLLRLLTLADEVKTMLEHGDIEMGHARALLALEHDAQIDGAQTIVNKSLSVREAEELVRRMQLPKLPEMPKSIDPDVRRLQDDLTDKIRMNVVIHHNSKGKGKLVVKYKDLTELDSLLAYFQ